MKINKKLLIITSIIILLPVLFGIWKWDMLPEQIATHWNIHNEPDQYSSKAFSVFGLPGIILLCHWFCMICTRYDPKRKNHSPKILHIVYWICPVISILCSTMTYSTALGINVNIGQITNIFVAFMFMFVGNYLPKCKQSYTIGIRIPWTLDDETNWYKTHKMAGTIWSISGFIMIISAILEIYLINIILMILAAIIPLIYSFILAEKQKKNDPKTK